MMHEKIEMEYFMIVCKDSYWKYLKWILLGTGIFLILFLCLPHTKLKKYDVLIEHNQFLLVIPEEEVEKLLTADIYLYHQKINYEVREITPGILETEEVQFQILKPNRYESKQKRTITVVYQKTMMGEYIYQTMKGWFV